MGREDVDDLEKIRLCLKSGTSGLDLRMLVDQFNLRIEGPYTVSSGPMEIFCFVPKDCSDLVMVDLSAVDFVESIELVDINKMEVRDVN